MSNILCTFAAFLKSCNPMKLYTRILFIACCLTFGATMMHAAEVVKVAILETIDKANEVKYGERLLVRSSLARAVAATPGFEAYDRVDLEAIFGEQNFQRTGYVSSDQIKQLGAMTGAQYILLPEIAKLNDKSFYITAKILDVETAKAVSVSGATTSNDVSAMEQACIKMANELLGLPSQRDEQQKQQKQQLTQGHMEEFGWSYDGKHYYQNGLPLKRSEVNKTVIASMKVNDIPAYNYYKKNSKPLINAGWTLFSIGLAGTLAVFPACLATASNLETEGFIASEGYSDIYKVQEIRDEYHHKSLKVAIGGYVSLGVCVMATIASIPCIAIGHKRLNQTINNYLLGTTIKPKYAGNMPNSGSQPYLSVDLQPTSNGVGLALSF